MFVNGREVEREWELAHRREICFSQKSKCQSWNEDRLTIEFVRVCHCDEVDDRWRHWWLRRRRSRCDLQLQLSPTVSRQVTRTSGDRCRRHLRLGAMSRPFAVREGRDGTFLWFVDLYHLVLCRREKLMIAEELLPEIETGQRFRPGQDWSVVSFYRATRRYP